jgi:hypothetical protein
VRRTFFVHAVRHVSSEQQVRARQRRQRGCIAPLQLHNLVAAARCLALRTHAKAKGVR